MANVIYADALAAALASAYAEGRRAGIEEAARAYQDAAGRVAVLHSMLREYQQANRIHNDSEAELFERAAAVLDMPAIPLTLARALSAPTPHPPGDDPGRRQP